MCPFKIYTNICTKQCNSSAFWCYSPKNSVRGLVYWFVFGIVIAFLLFCFPLCSQALFHIDIDSMDLYYGVSWVCWEICDVTVRPLYSKKVTHVNCCKDECIGAWDFCLGESIYIWIYWFFFVLGWFLQWELIFCSTNPPLYINKTFTISALNIVTN